MKNGMRAVDVQIVMGILAGATALATASEAQAQAPSFSDLGLLTSASGISADGAIVSGNLQSGSNPPQAARWTAAGAVGLGYLPGLAGATYFTSSANAISNDGNVIIGTSFSQAGNAVKSDVFRWTQATGMVGLGIGAGDKNGPSAAAVNADGSVVVGSTNPTVNGGPTPSAYRWTQSTGAVKLGTLGASPGLSPTSAATGVSGDGGIVVGYSSSANSFTQAFRWQAGAMTGLGFLPGATDSSATAISSNGQVIVGSSNFEAFRWTQAGGIVSLGQNITEGGSTGFQSSANATSGDGAVTVGNIYFGNGISSATRWTTATGPKLIGSLLTGAGVNLGGWHLDDANAVSTSGEFIAGSGTNPSGARQAYLVRYVDGSVAATPTPTPAPVPTPTPIPAPTPSQATVPSVPAPVAGLTTPGSVQDSVGQTAAARRGIAQQQHGFVAALLGDNGRVGVESGGGAFGAGGSVAGGVSAAKSFGNGFTLFGGMSLAAEDYKRAKVESAFTVAVALRYIYDLTPQIHPYGEVGGFWSPGGRYTFSRTYANGAGTATGVGKATGTQVYVFGRLGAAFDVTASDQIGLSLELGRQTFRTGAYQETFSAANPFNANIAASRDSTTVGKAKLQATHAFTQTIDAGVWMALARGFGARTTLVAFVPGIGSLSPAGKGGAWVEYGARAGYIVNETFSLEAFADGVSGGSATGTRVHFGGGAKVRF